MEDIDLLDSVADNIKGRTICALGDAAAMPVRGMLKHFRDEFVHHVEHKTCMVAALRLTAHRRTMIEIELDGKKVSVAEGSMVMHAADAAGIYIPHFCYHKKLSIAANCRMCLVDIEKAPKPMPACATPVTNGMVVRTKSDKARQGAAVGDGVPAHQPPAGLPHLRPGRRMPAAGPGGGLRRLAPRATTKKSASSSTRTSAR